jgi:hypothetical protein
MVLSSTLDLCSRLHFSVCSVRAHYSYVLSPLLVHCKYSQLIQYKFSIASNGETNIFSTVVVLAQTVTSVDSSLDSLSFDPHTSVVAYLLPQKRHHQSWSTISSGNPYEHLVSKECSNFTVSSSFSTLLSFHYFGWVLLQHPQQFKPSESIHNRYFYHHFASSSWSRAV